MIINRFTIKRVYIVDGYYYRIIDTIDNPSLKIDIPILFESKDRADIVCLLINKEC